jgi:hypothetical protein
VVSSPQQSSLASNWRRWARLGSTALTQQTLDHLKNTTVLAHSTKNTLENHPAEPWIRTEAQDPSQEEKLKQLAATLGGEGQAVIQEEKDKTPGDEPGGEGQARSKPQLTSKQ